MRRAILELASMARRRGVGRDGARGEAGCFVEDAGGRGFEIRRGQVQ